MTKARTLADNFAADINQVNAGVGITGGGTSGTVTITNDMATTINAAGDLVYGTANDAYTRLGIGTAGQYLKVNSGATAPEWATVSAGGMTAIATGTLSGSSVAITSIPNTYEQLLLKIYNPYITTGTAIFQCTVNNNTTANQYTTFTGTTGLDDASAIRLNAANTTLDDITSSRPSVVIAFENYTSTNSTKVGHLYFYNQSTGDRTFVGWGFKGANTSAISSIEIKTSASTFAGGTYTLWGVK